MARSSKSTRKAQAKPHARRSLKPVEKADIALADSVSLEGDSVAGARFRNEAVGVARVLSD